MKPDNEVMNAQIMIEKLLKTNRVPMIERIELLRLRSQNDIPVKPEKKVKIQWSRPSFERADITDAYDGKSKEPSLIDYYTPSQINIISPLAGHKVNLLDKQNRDRDISIHRLSIELLQKYHPIKQVRLNIKRFDRNRCHNDYLEHAEQQKSNPDPDDLGKLGMDFHCWVSDMEDNVGYDPQTCGHQKWVWDAREGTDTYVPFSTHNQQQKWSLLRLRMTNLKPYLRNPMYGMCHKNAAAYVKSERKKGNTNLKIVIGSYGFINGDGELYWQWGDGGDGSAQNYPYDIKDISVGAFTDKEIVDTSLKDVVNEAVVGGAAERHMPLNEFLREHGHKVALECAKMGMTGDPDTIAQKIIDNIENTSLCYSA